MVLQIVSRGLSKSNHQKRKKVYIFINTKNIFSYHNIQLQIAVLLKLHSNNIFHLMQNDTHIKYCKLNLLNAHKCNKVIHDGNHSVSDLGIDQFLLRYT